MGACRWFRFVGRALRVERGAGDRLVAHCLRCAPISVEDYPDRLVLRRARGIDRSGCHLHPARGAPMKMNRGRMSFGLWLILIGAILVLNNLGWLDWKIWVALFDLWPVLLILWG